MPLTDKFCDERQQMFHVNEANIVANKYDLSINCYKEIEYQEVEYKPPSMILDQPDTLEKEIQKDLKALRGML